mgnify:CR=1 FL=1
MKINKWLLILMFLGNGLTFLSQNNISLIKFVDYPKVQAYKAKKSKNSSMFQGNKKTKKYFEGWYFKMVSQDEISILSVIPGISISEDGSTKHAFIQIIDGKTAKTEGGQKVSKRLHQMERKGYLYATGQLFWGNENHFLGLARFVKGNRGRN